MDSQAIYQAFLYYAVFLFSTTLHEAAHAWAALRGGDPTAYLGGQVTLDPRPHIRRQPFGMVLLPVLTALTSGWPMGFASAPYDPIWAQRHPRRAAWMALAGPAANLMLVVVAGLLIRGGMLAGGFREPTSVGFAQVTMAAGGGTWAALATIVSVLFSLNLVLLALNILPIPPLDGASAVPLFLSASAAQRYRAFVLQPMFGWVGILIAWRLFDRVFHPVFLVAVNLLYPGAGFGR